MHAYSHYSYMDERPVYYICFFISYRTHTEHNSSEESSVNGGVGGNLSRLGRDDTLLPEEAKE